MSETRPWPAGAIPFDAKTMIIVCVYPKREFVVPNPSGRVLVIVDKPENPGSPAKVMYCPFSEYVSGQQCLRDAVPLLIDWEPWPEGRQNKTGRSGRFYINEKLHY